MGGNYSSAYGHSRSVSRQSNNGLEDSFNGDDDDEEDVLTPTPSFRTSISGREVGSSIPMPSNRMSGAGMSGGIAPGRRTSSGFEKLGDMPPPERKKPLKGIGEIR